MKPVLFALFIVLLGSTACKDKKQNAEKNSSGDRNEEQVVQHSSNDSAEIRNVVTEFYTWYNKNYPKFDEYKLYSSVKKKDEPPYKINWDEVEKYHAFIRSFVPQLGEEFIKNQIRFFQQCDSAFKRDISDDIPFGFDYDWYTNSQEDPQYLLDEINAKDNWWEIRVNGNRATVEVKGYADHNGKQAPTSYMTLEMKKENDKWKIAKIGKDFNEE